MSKIFKEKIKRSLPLIVIFCLLNVLTLGFSFNLNLNFVKTDQDGFVKMAAGALADTATTTVTVKNAPPYFSAGPSESPTSTTTTPVNVGGSIGFTGTATDGEGDDYWLIICNGATATSTPGTNIPTCVASTQFCISTIASSTAGTSCTYDDVTDPGSEMQTWYAFVCDDHGGDPRCSVAAQGTGDGGSPFYVNHAPTLDLVYTSVDNQAPGDNFTITASTSDGDIQGGVDHLSLYVCSTNSWTLSSGCTGTTLCTGSSTVPTSVSCNYATEVPRMHAPYTYYGFINDWHHLSATSTGNGASSVYNVSNVAPIVSDVTLHQGINITLNIKGAPEVDVAATSSSVTDNNGCLDLASATSTIYFGDVASGANCTADDNYCYPIAAGNCFLSGCDGASDATAQYICTTSLAFHAMPTDASSKKASSTSWFAKIKATDALGLNGSGSYTTVDGVEVVSAAALEVQQLQIPYGTVQAGTNTGTNGTSTTVINYGNTPIDTDLTGVDMDKVTAGTEIIGIENQKHSLTIGFDYNTMGTQMSSTTPTREENDIPRPTSGVNVDDNIYWGINVPLGTPSASYAGYNTFTVVFDQYDNWQYP